MCGPRALVGLGASSRQTQTGSCVVIEVRKQALAWLIVSTVACGGTEEPGPSRDSGSPPNDASSAFDGGSPRDAGAPPDASEGDGGPFDGGRADTGAVDGGPPPVCGDGRVDESEACDDGPDNSDTTPDACRTDCSLPSCGDDVIDPGQNETCDDGNVVDGDGCSASCEDEDECARGVDTCTFYEVCVNENPGFTCSCVDGAFLVDGACFRYPLPYENPPILPQGLEVDGIVASGDFDGNSHTDLLVRNVNRGMGSSVHPLLGQPDGRFVYPPNAPAVGAAASDRFFLSPLDGNSVGDIIRTSDLSTLFYADGVTQTSFAGGARETLHVADFDGDGQGEVVNRTINGAVMNDPAAVKQTFPVVATAAASADLNGDGALDLILLGGGAFVALNGGPPTSTLGNLTLVPDTQSLDRFGLGDVDEDGDVDFLASTYYRANDGSGAFGPQTPLPFSGDGSEARFEDFTGDGRPDVSLGTASDLIVHTRTGSVSFGAQRRYRIFGSTFVKAYFDADHDGRVDIVFGGPSPVGEETPILVGRGTPSGPSLPRAFESNVFSRFDRVVVVDFDGDQDLDVIRYALTGTSNPILLRNNGVGEFVVLALGSFFGGGADRVDILDIDDDGRLDMIIARDDLIVHRGDANGGFTFTPVVSTIPADDFDWIDVDGDDDLDLVACTATSLRVYTNVGASFAPGQVLANGSCPVAVGDLNGDVFPDVLAGLSGPALGAFLGSSGGTLSAAVTTVPSHPARDLRLRDIDGDGLDDVLVGGPHLLHARNTGSGFDPFQDLGVCAAFDSYDTSIQTTDVDGDGDRDIVALCSDRVRIALQLGLASFEIENLPTTGAEQVAVGDIDGDGRPDLFFAAFRDIWMAGTR